jgi:hypothetical protein
MRNVLIIEVTRSGELKVKAVKNMPSLICMSFLYFTYQLFWISAYEYLLMIETNNYAIASQKHSHVSSLTVTN